MFNTKSMLTNAAFTAAAATVTVMTVAPAQAAQLNGSISASGASHYTESGANTIISFSEEVVNQVSGDFANFFPDLDNSSFTMKDLKLNDSNNDKVYQNEAVESFIDFGERTLKGETAKLTFNLFGGFDFLKVPSRSSTSTSYQNISGIEGAFKFGDDTIADGFLNSSVSSGSSSFQFTLDAKSPSESQSVPEPGTLLGLAAFGFLPLARKKKTTAV